MLIYLKKQQDLTHIGPILYYGEVAQLSYFQILCSNDNLDLCSNDNFFPGLFQKKKNTMASKKYNRSFYTQIFKEILNNIYWK